MRRTRDKLIAFPAALLLAASIVFGAWRVDEASERRQRETRDLIERIQREGAERRDQTCTVFERDHLEDVQTLRRTYVYLLALSAAERRTTLNRFVLSGLSRLESEARTDSAPDFCDVPGVGLPEPDPVVPARPVRLR